MLLKNVKANWLFINRVDDNGNYRVAFEVTKEQELEIMQAMDKLAKDNGAELAKCDWQGSRKEEDGVITFAAKMSSSLTNKKGETVEVTLPVYNIKAQRLADDEIPSVKNGATVNIAVEPYFAKHKNKKGVMLGLRSIQLIDYELYEGSNPFVDESSDNVYNNSEEDIFQ